MQIGSLSMENLDTQHCLPLPFYLTWSQCWARIVYPCAWVHARGFKDETPISEHIIPNTMAIPDLPTAYQLWLSPWKPLEDLLYYSQNDNDGVEKRVPGAPMTLNPHTRPREREWVRLRERESISYTRNPKPVKYQQRNPGGHSFSCMYSTVIPK